MQKWADRKGYIHIRYKCRYKATKTFIHKCIPAKIKTDELRGDNIKVISKTRKKNIGI